MSKHDIDGFTILGRTQSAEKQPVIGVDKHEPGYERQVRSEPKKKNRAFDTLRDTRHPAPIVINLERVDTVIMNYLRDHIKPSVSDSGKQIIVPIEYANAERWKQVRKDGVIRDDPAKVQTPLILFRRTGVRRNPLTNPVNRFVDRTFQIGWNRHNTYDQFAVLNRILPSRELVKVTMPDYVDLLYDFLIWTDYVTQMNAVIEQLNGEMDSYWGQRGDFKFRVWVEDYTTENDVPAEGDRYVKTTFQMKVNAYLLPESLVSPDFGIQATDQLRYSLKKVVFTQEIEGLSIRGEPKVTEKFPSVGTNGGEV